MSAPRRYRRKERPAPGRERAFFIFTIAFPFVFLLIAEGILRAVGYGPDLSLFRVQEFSGREYLNMNPAVKHRYFSSVEFNPMTSIDLFEAEKPDSVFRIFCLGGSTTAGYPYGYIGSFSSFLKQRLEHAFPEKTFDVINLGLTATNSFTTLDFADELIEYDPDLLIVYDGHNEFYGALGLASHESAGRSKWLSDLSLQMVHLRTFLLLRDLSHDLFGLFRNDEAETGGTMMERLARGQTVPFDSELYRDTRDAYVENLADLLSLYSRHGIPVIVSAQVSNLRDLPPFVSSDERLQDRDKLLFSQMYRKGLGELLSDMPDSASRSFHAALQIDTMSADAWYYLGRSRSGLGDSRGAFEAYSRARDFDELRFRQSDDFNRRASFITEKAGQLFVDMEALFRSASPDSIPGHELILEHLHPTARGYFLMASGFAAAMRLRNIPGVWPVVTDAADDSLWNARWMTELDERIARRRTDVLISGWPFPGEPVPMLPPDSTDRIGMIVDEVLDGKLAWEQSHVAAAEYYEGNREFGKAEAEYVALIAMTPKNVSPYLHLGRLRLKQLHYNPAREVLLRSLDIEPTLYALRALAAIEVDTGNPSAALPHLRRAMTTTTAQQEHTELYFMMAIAAGRAGRNDEAAGYLETVLTRDPSFSRARTMLEQLRAEGK